MVDCIFSPLTVIQAALLIAGEDPSVAAAYVEGWDVEKRPVGYEAAKAALTNGIKAGLIEANIGREEKWYHEVEEYVPIDGTVNIALTTLSVSSIKRFLKSRGFHSDFFFPNHDSGQPDYLDTQHPNYSPKLAAAIEAWVMYKAAGQVLLVEMMKTLRIQQVQPRHIIETLPPSLKCYFEGSADA